MTFFLFWKSETNNLSVNGYSDWDYSRLCELYYKHPWLSKETNHEGLEALWFDFEKREERAIIKTLLENFRYLTFEQAESILKVQLLKCREEWGILPANTIFVAIRKTKFADGSSMFLQFLKTILVQMDINWEEHNLISEMKDGIKYSKKGKMNEQGQIIEKVVLIDDFIGTGETAKKQILEFKKSLSGIDHKVDVYFLGLAGMNFGLAKASESGVLVKSVIELDRGINLSYSRFRRKKIRRKMVEMERILAPQIKNYSLSDHSLGWGKSEALFSINRFNIPNNVFPVFWWKRYRDNRNRNTLFNRLQ